MADSVFNIAKGHVAEYYRRVKGNDPANSAIVIVALKASGLETHAVLKDHDTLSAILAAANDEATNSGYARKALTDADLAALPAPDDTNDRKDLDLPDQTWTTVAAAGGAWGMILVCYDPDTTAGTDADIIPLTMHDFAQTPDGTDLLLAWNASGFYRAA